MTDSRQVIAKNIANMLRDGEFINLGVGIPTLVGKYISEDKCNFGEYIWPFRFAFHRLAANNRL